MRYAMPLLWAASLYGQCSQCFRTAAAQQTASMRAVNTGILVMLLPVLTLLGGFCLLAYRRRDP